MFMVTNMPILSESNVMTRYHILALCKLVSSFYSTVTEFVPLHFRKLIILFD